jgi:hypothetical protein
LRLVVALEKLESRQINNERLQRDEKRENDVILPQDNNNYDTGTCVPVPVQTNFIHSFIHVYVDFVTRMDCLDAVRRDEFLQSRSQNFEETRNPCCRHAVSLPLSE